MMIFFTPLFTLFTQAAEISPQLLECTFLFEGRIDARLELKGEMGRLFLAGKSCEYRSDVKNDIKNDVKRKDYRYTNLLLSTLNCPSTKNNFLNVALEQGSARGANAATNKNPTVVIRSGTHLQPASCRIVKLQW